MTLLIPNLNSCLPRMTSGERRFAKCLKEKLENEAEEDGYSGYSVWYNVPVGLKYLHPDFIILHPCRGILILEVKDWDVDHIRQANPDFVSLMTSGGVSKKKNPLEQARNYAHAVADLLKRDPLLVEPPESKFQGNLVMPWGYGAIFANITRKNFEKSGLGEVFRPNLVICKDEMTQSAEPKIFQQRLWGMLRYSFGKMLTRQQVDRIRWHLFPEIRIESQLSLFKQPQTVSEETEKCAVIPELIRIMDLKQEQLARSLRDGHRVIHGVSGSGKTLILCYRSIYLAEELRKPVLVLCFNIALAIKISQIIGERGLNHRVTVRHFHGWCLDQLRYYRVPKPPNDSNFFDALVQRVIDAAERGQIPPGQYGAVLIDEVHDFKPEWLKLAARMVDPETESLLLVYDNAQSIYRKRSPLGFSFSSAGIMARGRTTILRKNYRNAAGILFLAYEFAKDIFELETKYGVEIVSPECAKRSAVFPEFVLLLSLQREAGFLAYRFQDIHKKGLPWNEIAVIYRQRFIGQAVADTLKKARIPFEWLHESKEKRYYRPDEDSVKIITMHSSKGLEFSTVAIPGLGYMPHRYMDYQDEVRLMYVAMTRAVDNLILTSSKDSDFTRKISEAMERVRSLHKEKYIDKPNALKLFC
jgi:hypothetical protein